jgi:hypothetical protein
MLLLSGGCVGRLGAGDLLCLLLHVSTVRSGTKAL